MNNSLMSHKIGLSPIIKKEVKCYHKINLSIIDKIRGSNDI